MAYKIVYSDYAPPAGESYVEIILDDKNDVSNLGTNYSPGSIAMVAKKDGSIYMMNASHVWEEI
jgi:hypothetical protein